MQIRNLTGIKRFSLLQLPPLEESVTTIPPLREANIYFRLLSLALEIQRSRMAEQNTCTGI